MVATQKVALNNGVLMDQLGFGMGRVPPPEAASLAYFALKSGFRHIDTAALYGNEPGVGEAVRRFISEGSASREDIFLTTKVWNENQGYDTTLRGFDDSLQQLGLDYVDLYLIHWPLPQRGLFVQTYRALERLYNEGRVRAIGVSNFLPGHLEQLMHATETVPAVNQIELHPWFQQVRLREFNERHGIRTIAWSPLARGAVLSDPVVAEVAREMRKTPAQIVLRWHLQLGNTAIPKTATYERMSENICIRDFTLNAATMARLASLDRPDGRIGSHPDEVN